MNVDNVEVLALQDCSHLTGQSERQGDARPRAVVRDAHDTDGVCGQRLRPNRLRGPRSRQSARKLRALSDVKSLRPPTVILEAFPCAHFVSSRQATLLQKLLRLTLVLTGTALMALMAACAPVSSPSGAGASASSAAAGATAVAVQMTDALKFDPASVTVPRGTMVTWRNTSQTAHTVTDDPAKAANPADAQLPSGAQAWDSGNVDPGQTFSHTFDTPGTYKYFCTPQRDGGHAGNDHRHALNVSAAGRTRHVCQLVFARRTPACLATG